MHLELVGVAVADTSRASDRGSRHSLITGDAKGLATDPDVDVVVELIGGIEPARIVVEAALSAGKPVVTGNKELLAAHGAELARAASRRRRRPALRGRGRRRDPADPGASRLARRRAHPAGHGHRERHDELHPLADDRGRHRLRRGARRGAAPRLAERDPTADVEGFDAAAKVAILAGLAFSCDVVVGDVYREGIVGLRGIDIAFADRLGYVVKLLAVAERTDSRRAGLEPSPRSRSGSTRRWSRASIRSHRCAGRSTRSSSRARAAAS